MTNTAKSTVEQVTKQAPATSVSKTADAPKKQAKAPATKSAPANDTVESVTGEVKQTTGKVLGNTPVVDKVQKPKVHKAHTLPAPAKKEASRTTELPAVDGTVTNLVPSTDALPSAGTLPSTDALPATGSLPSVGTLPSTGSLPAMETLPATGQVLGGSPVARDAEALPATAAADVVPNVDVTDTSVVADVVATATGTVDESLPATVDLGDHGYVDSVTDVFGTVDGFTTLAADEHGLSGITSISGVLDTASTLTADVPGVASVFGYSSTFATVDAVAEAAGDLSTGDLYGFGAVTSTLDSFNVLDVDAGDLGYLNATASVSGWLDAIGHAYANLHSGDVAGFLAATGALDAVLTADGQLADVAGVSGVVTASGLVDGFLAAFGNVYEGDLSAAGGLFAVLDATADGYGWVDGVGDVTLTSPMSSVVVDETLDLLEVDL